MPPKVPPAGGSQDTLDMLAQVVMDIQRQQADASRWRKEQDERRADEERRRDELELRRLEADDRREKLDLQMTQALAKVGAGAAGAAGGQAVVTAGQGPTKAFDISHLEEIPSGARFRDFRLWREAWEANGKRHKLHLFGREEQVYAFLQAAGTRAARVLKFHFKVDPDHVDTSVDRMTRLLEDYYRASQSETVAGVRFAQRAQRPGESFDDFRFALDELAADAEFCGHCEDRRLAEQLIAGLEDGEVRAELLRLRKPSVDQVVELCRAHEVAARENKVTVRGSLRDGAVVDAVRARTAYKERQRDEMAAKTKGKCSSCGGREHARPAACPAAESRCHRCGERGHWKPRCPKVRREGSPGQGGRATGSNRDPVGISYVGAVDSVLNAAVDDAVDGAAVCSVEVPPIVPGMDVRGFCRLRYVWVDVASVAGEELGRLAVLPDTGASASLMSRRDFAKLRGNRADLVPLTRPVRGVEGSCVDTDGTAYFAVSFHGRRLVVPFTVTPAYAGTLLSNYCCELLGAVVFPAVPGYAAQAASVIGGVPPEPTSGGGPLALESRGPPGERGGRESLCGEGDGVAGWREGVFRRYADVFDDEEAPLRPMIGEPMVIELRPGAVPTRLNCPRPIPLAIRDKAKRLLDDLEGRGVIRRIAEPTAWCHPVTFVLKPTGKLRLCVDLSGLNKFVDRPIHPIRAPKEVVAVVPPTARYFSTFDASSGYFQVPLAEESQALTTFVTPWGRYVHLRATMGLSSSSDEYNRRGDAAMEGLDNVSKIVDDVLVYAETLAEHQEAVERFLERCRVHGITLNRAKTRLAAPQVKFAGYLVGRDGVSADPAKLRALKEFPRPTNVTDLRSFLGLVEQLAGFSRSTAAAMGPLRPLLSPKNEFLWNSDHDDAFAATKEALVLPPVLTTSTLR